MNIFVLPILNATDFTDTTNYKCNSHNSEGGLNVKEVTFWNFSIASVIKTIHNVSAGVKRPVVFK